MTRPSAFLLAPETPSLTSGGGGMRTASILAYLQQRYCVDVAHLDLPRHSRSVAARVARNSLRLIRGRPPLFDRYSGFEDQVKRQLKGSYRVAVIEHFWCAPYANTLRPHADLLILDLHNVESALAHSHANAVAGLESAAFERFGRAYRELEREWLPRFDIVLVASEEDRRRVLEISPHPNVIVYPNALPHVDVPKVKEQDCIVFSGNLEYHPNVEAVRWFHREVWPHVSRAFPTLEWRLVGRNAQAIQPIIEGDSRISATGPVDDALPLLAEAKAVVVPLRSGSGTRFKILEAWAAGRAVVSTTIGAEGLNAHEGRQLMLADSAVAFVDALSTVLRDANLRARLGEEGHQFWEEHYTWPHAWKALGAAGI